jgi:excisionase family DNA binding protein
MLRSLGHIVQSSPEEIPLLACSVEHAAKVLGISRTTLFQLIKDGKLHPVKIGRRTLLAMTDLKSYIEQMGGVR